MQSMEDSQQTGLMLTDLVPVPEPPSSLLASIAAHFWSLNTVSAAALQLG